MRLILFIFLGIYSGSLLGQGRSIPAQIKTLDGEIVTGQLKLRNWDTNPTSIEFKALTDSEWRALTADDIQGFTYGTNDRFESHTVQIDTSKFMLNRRDPENPEEPKIITKRIFLKVLIEGTIGLYVHVDWRKRKHFFLRQKADTPEELIYRMYVEHDEFYQRIDIVDDRFFEVFQFRAQLMEVLGVCIHLEDDIKKVLYREKALQKLLLEFYDCRRMKPSFVHERERLAANFSVHAGVSRSTLKLADERRAWVEDLRFDPHYAFTAAASIEIFPERPVQLWSYLATLTYREFMFQKTVDQPASDNVDARFRKLEIGAKQLVLQHCVRLTSQTAKFKPFFGFGAESGLNLRNDHLVISEWPTLSGVEVKAEGFWQVEKRVHLGLLLQTGVKYEHFVGTLQYDLAGKLGDNSGRSSQVGSLTLLLGYQF